MPTKFCTTVTVLPPRPAFTRMMSTRALDLRGGSFRFVSFELPGGRPPLFKSANGLLKSLTLDLCPLAIECPCLPETTPILQSPRLMPKRSVSSRLPLQLLAKKLLPRAPQIAKPALRRETPDDICHPTDRTRNLSGFSGHRQYDLSEKRQIRQTELFSLPLLNHSFRLTYWPFCEEISLL